MQPIGKVDWLSEKEILIEPIKLSALNIVLVASIDHFE